LTISLDQLQPLRGALLLAVPVLLVLAALLPTWRMARLGAAGVVALAASSFVLFCVGGPLVLRGFGLPLGDVATLYFSVRVDALGSTVLLLVSFIGWVITRYSQSYLGGDAGQARYIRWLMATLAAVSVVVITNNLAVLAAAWLATSLSLHQLLTFFSTRPAALIAAHKKFLASRLGDVCLFTAVAFIAISMGSLEIDQVTAKAQSLFTIPWALQAGVYLIVMSALLKCAQLPVHGWLIQVMEAPTPVSALLHAGIVNLGGFLLIRLSPLVSDVSGAQTLLVVVGSITAAVAALVMMTRISVKVMLAWSTCAQMGFMLMQCGLGAYDLALLHLVAHSLYKAHAFLAAGGAVEQARLKAMSPPQAEMGLSMSVVGAISGLAMVAAAGLVWGAQFGQYPALWAMAAIVSLALAPLLTARALRMGGLWPLAVLAAAFGVAFTYFGLHHVFALWVDLPETAKSVNAFNIAWVMVCFAGLFALQSLIRARPRGTVARSLYPWFYAGLYLDEWFTRLTFRIWPARLSSAVSGSTPGVFK
jgi:NAD(P)H-quinone oxidoreductase subunit 5